ncbi:Lipase, GDSL [Cynara cardunculus var. scolymus]|uniref:Lipase, GDSL n=1 Tax=Cynara cardunculus var. scolymus TaxID=59895 RepID=A0A103XV20_CYNCS|nr:Lipase, GDSL [Cynara cardunculus var. scolymus]
MAFSSSSWHFTSLFVIFQLLWSGNLYANGCYTSIISFGDSLADTGNLKQLASITNRVFPVLLPPYGENFYDQSTGRCSNGRLIIDFLGATALDSSFLEPRGILNTMTNASLQVQLSWFKKSLRSICGNASGNLPIGCSSAYLTICGSEKEEYDNTTGCLIRLNKFAEYHNELLQTKLNQIRELHPDVIVIYADYYNAALQIYRSPDKFGFTNGGLKACCGGGGPFNFNSSAECGCPNTSVCDQPDTYVSWDGIHLTEAAYRLISENLFQGSYTTPRFNSLCPTLTSQVRDKLSTSM